ncbi:MAG: uroporphyrinogen-III C-methyltransferase [Timaviella obliquedivisa GSE-PSE-MK23-08B]|jgi:uroporphyrinogen III methyltransferase/synthase|nr:uroporphyrinogen-III C-methyltransferase [Timaviella obliquedivisa GSE-PSE-MK23-08B]
MANPAGRVFLVGSGVGSLAYLTVRGQQLLSGAEVLVHDALVDEELLQLVPKSCLKLNVGKRGGLPSATQETINHLLVKHCQQGKQVVRLKSGDPFIFGRSTSEIQALNEAECPFEVVPGISSALAAPLLAGIPLTDPVLSRCFAVLSAHEPEALDWEALARLETLVILMGARHLPIIVEQLLRHGRSPQTPIAIIRWAGHPAQQIWIGTLEDIVQKTSRQSLSPAVITIGEVVRLRSYLQSCPNDLSLSFPAVDAMAVDFINSHPLPLTGKTIIVTRAAGQSSQFTHLLEEQGATVVEMPALEIGQPSSWEALDTAIAQISQFDWLILTSTNGVNYFFERLLAQGKDARALAGIKVAVVGQKTADSLKQYGIQPDYVPPDFVADSLIEHFPENDLAGLKILFPRVETGGREVLVKEFVAKKAIVTEVAAYQSICVQEISPEVLNKLSDVDVITFASSKTVNCVCQLLETRSRLERWDDSLCIASIGPQTSAACKQWLGRVDIEAEDYTLEGLTQAIVTWARKK